MYCVRNSFIHHTLTILSRVSSLFDDDKTVSDKGIWRREGYRLYGSKPIHAVIWCVRSSVFWRGGPSRKWFVSQASHHLNPHCGQTTSSLYFLPLLPAASASLCWVNRNRSFWMYRQSTKVAEGVYFPERKEASCMRHGLPDRPAKSTSWFNSYVVDLSE